MAAPFEFLGCGRNRMVFRHGHYVVKLPLDWRGAYDNEYEYRTYRRGPSPDGIRYARCRLLGAILIMEYVEPLLSGYPPWADYVDCHQVGLTWRGEVVAYDFGWF